MGENVPMWKRPWVLASGGGLVLVVLAAAGAFSGGGSEQPFVRASTAPDFSNEPEPVIPTGPGSAFPGLREQVEGGRGFIDDSQTDFRSMVPPGHPNFTKFDAFMDEIDGMQVEIDRKMEALADTVRRAPDAETADVAVWKAKNEILALQEQAQIKLAEASRLL